MERKRRIVIAMLLLLAIGKFSRLKGNENIRVIQFVSIFAIGALSAVLISNLAKTFKAKGNPL